MFINFTICSIIFFVNPLASDKFFFLLKEVQDPMCHWLIRNYILLSLLCPSLDGLRLLQMCQDHNFMKLDRIEKRLYGNENVFDVDL